MSAKRDRGRLPPKIGVTIDAVTSLSERAREQVSATASEREGVKRPRGGLRGSEAASRWELLMELEGAYSLIAELAERVESLEVEIKRDH